MSKTALVTLKGICKSFGPVRANDGVDLEIRSGEVLALLGENGAGKSTLMKVLYGLYRADAGEVWLEGRRVQIDSPRAAIALGIGMVFQQFALVPALSVIENLLAAWPDAPWWQARRRPVLARVLDRLRALVPHLDPSRPVRSLSVGERQLVELAKVLNLKSRVVILDEPTSVLTPVEAARLHGFVRALAAEGKAIVLITHKLADVAACADRVAVMRGGRLVDVAHAGDRTADQLVETMVGREALDAVASPAAPGGRYPKLQVLGLSAKGPAGEIRQVQLDLVAGEVLGIAGVSGNGQTTLAEALAGLLRPTSGDIVLEGTSIAARSDESAVAHTVAYLPDRPLDNAVVSELDAATNLALRRIRTLPLISNRDRLRSRAHELMTAFGVRPPDPDLPAALFSGGNLQKLVIGRELSGKPELVVACYPTMGLDVAASQAVYRLLFEHAARGACVVWISEDLDDLLRHAHRIAVMQDGRITGIAARGEANRQTLGRWMVAEQAAVA